MSTTTECVAMCDIDRNVLNYCTVEKVEWDDAKQSFKTSTTNKIIVPEYHNGWTLPNY